MTTRLKSAGELMIPLEKYPHLPYWFTLRQAMAEMEKSEFDIDGRKSLPRVVLVFDEKYRLLGTVRRRDILRGMEPLALVHSSAEERARLFDARPAESAAARDEYFARLRERAERPVRDVMRPIVATAAYDDHVLKIVFEMVDHDLHLLPVLKEGSVVGVVRTVDVFHEIAHVLL